MTDTSVSGSWPRWAPWLIGAAFFTVAGLLSFSYQYLDVFVRGGSEPFAEKLIEELTGAWGAGLLFPLLIWYARRLRHRPWWAQVAAHVAAVPLYSATHTTWNWGSRELAFAVWGIGNYDYGIMWLRYLMEFPNDVLFYGFFVAGIVLFDHYRASRDRELHLARLEGELSRLRLQTLEARLRPHFLFNALNTISSVMYEDRAAADRMLSGLSDLLRRSLADGELGNVPLATELDLLEGYLDIMRARFTDRLEVRVDVPEGVRDAGVPQLLLQPLVENALEHGDPGPGRPARVEITGRRQNGRVHLSVRDNGPGAGVPTSALLERGIGLSTTVRRLEEQYGPDRTFRAGDRAGGGFEVAIEIPYRPVGEPS